MRPRPEVLLRLAESHWAASHGESHSARYALGCYAKNLLERAGFGAEDAAAMLMRLGPPNQGDLPLTEYRDGIAQSISVLKEVWEGQEADPTEGAVRAHRHDESPLWADRAWPTTLIGPWMFYRALH